MSPALPHPVTRYSRAGGSLHHAQPTPTSHYFGLTPLNHPTAFRPQVLFQLSGGPPDPRSNTHPPQPCQCPPPTKLTSPPSASAAAQVLFEIPDIRLFWTDDERFHKQFKGGQLTKFKSYSKYPPCYKDIAFWLPEKGFEPNDFYELGRGVAGVGCASLCPPAHAPTFQLHFCCARGSCPRGTCACGTGALAFTSP